MKERPGATAVMTPVADTVATLGATLFNAAVLPETRKRAGKLSHRAWIWAASVGAGRGVGRYVAATRLLRARPAGASIGSAAEIRDA